MSPTPTELLSSKTESQKLIDWVERLVSLVQLDNGAADEDTPNLALLKRRLSGETTAPPPCVFRDGCKKPEACVAKGCCSPPEMRGADSNDDLLRAVRYLIICARTSGEKRDDGLCAALDRVESILADRYCVTGCGEVSGVKFHAPNCRRSAVKSVCEPSASTGDTPPAPTSPVECPKCRTQLAFEGDECGLCKEEES